MKLIMKYILLFVALCSTYFIFAQTDTTASVSDTTKRDKYVRFYEEEDPFKQFEAKEEPKKFKKKKPKRRVYYGFKTRRGYTKEGVGAREKRQIFHYLKVYQKPSIYAKEIYWYHKEKKKIMKTKPSKVDPAVARILHGPYKKLIDGKVIEKGVFYVGTKHARWEMYKKPRDYNVKDTIEIKEEQILIKKEKWWKGFPKDSKITFYDKKKGVIQEVIPIVNGEKHGYYCSFYENGLPKEKGNYIRGQKVGKWIEYFKTERRSIKKKETIYPRNPYVEQFEPYLSKEWDRQRHVIYDHEKGGKQEIE